MTEIWQNKLNNPINYKEVDNTAKLQILFDNTSIIKRNKDNITSAAKIEGLAVFNFHIKKTSILKETQTIEIKNKRETPGSSYSIFKTFYEQRNAEF